MHTDIVDADTHTICTVYITLKFMQRKAAWFTMQIPQHMLLLAVVYKGVWLKGNNSSCYHSPNGHPLLSVMLLFMLQLLPLPERSPTRFCDVTHSSCYDCYHSLNVHSLVSVMLCTHHVTIVTINSLYRPIRGSSLSRALYFLSSGDNFSVMWGHFCVLWTCDLGQHVRPNSGFCLLQRKGVSVSGLFRRQERNVFTLKTEL